ncbi:MAG TPA: oligosaccharide flippase family protein [Dongiaceae bacterium]|nr:oligosaccharide flippase family protein [Dongiaceae bacterium]
MRRCFDWLPGFARPWWARVESSALGARLARGAFWSLAGAAITRCLALAGSVLVARILGKEGFGELGIIQSTTGMFGVFAGFGLGLTSTKYVAEFRAKDPPKAGRIMALSAVVAWMTGAVAAAALWVVAPWLAEHSLAAPHLAPGLRISCLMVLLGAVNGAQMGALVGFESFKAVAGVNLLTGLASVPLPAFGAWIWGLDGAVWGLVGSMALNAVLNNLALRTASARARVPMFPPRWRGEWEVVWRFNAASLLSSGVSWPAQWLCGAIVVNQPDGYAQMGIYNVAAQWRTGICTIPAAVLGIVLPVLSGLHGDGDRRTFAKVVRYHAALNGAIAALLAAPVAMLAPVILSAYGAAFLPGCATLRTLSVVAVAMSISAVTSQAMAGAGRVVWMVGTTLICAGLAVVGTYLMRNQGAMGLAWSLLAAQVLSLLMGAAFVTTTMRDKAPATPGSSRKEAPVL